MEQHTICPIDNTPHAGSSRLPCCYAILYNLPKSLPKIVCCLEHMNKRIKYKCNSHEKYLCSECILDHSGSGHEIGLFAVNLKQIEKDLRELASVSECVVSDAKGALLECKYQGKQIREFYEEQAIKVNSVFSDAVELMNVKRKGFLDKLKSELKEQEIKIEIKKNKWYKSLEKGKQWAKNLGDYQRKFEGVSYEEFNKYLVSTYEDITDLSDYKTNHVELKYYGYNGKLDISDLGDLELVDYRGDSWPCLECELKNEEVSTSCSRCKRSETGLVDANVKAIGLTSRVREVEDTKGDKPRHRKNRRLHNTRFNSSF